MELADADSDDALAAKLAFAAGHGVAWADAAPSTSAHLQHGASSAADLDKVLADGFEYALTTGAGEGNRSALAARLSVRKVTMEEQLQPNQVQQVHSRKSTVLDIETPALPSAASIRSPQTDPLEVAFAAGIEAAIAAGGGEGAASDADKKMAAFGAGFACGSVFEGELEPGPDSLGEVYLKHFAKGEMLFKLANM